MKSDYRLFSVSLIWLIIVFFVPAISAEEFFYPDQIKKGKELTGRVRDAATGEPVIGASVFLEGTTIGAITDIYGNYTITYPGGRHTVVASYLGYKPSKAVVAEAQILDFALYEDLVELEEAVVVGYGTQRKMSIVGAITTVDVDDI